MTRVQQKLLLDKNTRAEHCGWNRATTQKAHHYVAFQTNDRSPYRFHWFNDEIVAQGTSSCVTPGLPKNSLALQMPNLHKLVLSFARDQPRQIVPSATCANLPPQWSQFLKKMFKTWRNFELMELMFPTSPDLQKSIITQLMHIENHTIVGAHKNSQSFKTRMACGLVDS